MPMARKPQQKQSKAQMLLLEYRPAIWRKSAFESIPGAGNKVLQACTEQMSLTQELVEMLRNNNSWVRNFTGLFTLHT